MTNMDEKYALVKDGEILEFRNYAPNVDQKLLAEGKPRMIKVEDNPPEYDPNIQYLEKSYDIQDEVVVVNYSVLEKPKEDIDSLISRKIQEIKDEARRRIYEILLDHQQINAMASGLENIFIFGADLTKWPKGEQDKAQMLLTKWNQIKDIRHKSDSLEANLYTLTNPKEISAYDPMKGW